MSKKNFLNFFYFLFPTVMFLKLWAKKRTILKGLEDITPEELEEAAQKASFFPPSITLRGVEISPVAYQGGISTHLWLLSDFDDKQYRRHLLSRLWERVCEEPKNAARQRAYLLGIALQGGV